MSHFSPKSLAFYGIAIGSVLTLFNVVTAYGNANLKAPPPIDGLYRLNSQNLPNCFESAPVLMIRQSGVYLHGELLTKADPTSLKKLGDKNLSLVGRWQNQSVNLSGPVSQFEACKGAKVTLTASWQDNTLSGQLSLSSTPQTANFTAKRELFESSPTSQH